MRYLLACMFLLGSIATCIEARAFDPAEINTLLASTETDTSYKILGILTLDYTFGDLLDKETNLHDVASGMLGVLKFIEGDATMAGKLEGLAPGLSIKNMTRALEDLQDELMSPSVTWREASKRSFARKPFKGLKTTLDDLAKVGIVLPITYLDEKHRPGEKEDGNYFLTTWYLENTDWREQFGDLRYYDLMTMQMCDAPCTGKISTLTMERVESVQAAIQLGILRTTYKYKSGGGVEIFSGTNCCKMPQRKCEPIAPLGCTTGANGYCTLGSYYCP